VHQFSGVSQRYYSGVVLGRATHLQESINSGLVEIMTDLSYKGTPMSKRLNNNHHLWVKMISTIEN